MTQCIALLGGTFDPVHQGHVALADYFARQLQPDLLRLIPAGNPWQKTRQLAPALDRIAMLQLAFADFPVPVAIDQQEVQRAGPSYTIDTLRAIRAEIGSASSLVFLLGADQLQQLDTWHEWRQLFDFAHLCVASRPGFSLQAAQVPAAVQQEFTRRAGTLQQIRSQPHGLTSVAGDLAIDVASTAIRQALQNGEVPAARLAPAVLDYIQQHHLYRSSPLRP